MEINFFNEDTSLPELDYFSVKDWIQTIIVGHSYKVGDINYVFCSDEYLLQMNKEHLQHDYYTDIITFNYCQDDLISGDIFISVDRVNDNALKFDTLETEIYRVIIHGILHLIGFDDHNDEEKQQMRSEEDKALSQIK